GQFINPPLDFVRDTAKQLHDVGSAFEGAVRSAVFASVVQPIRPVSLDNPPSFVLELIELFDYFGRLPNIELTPSPAAMMGSAENVWAEQQRISIEYRKNLIEQCLLMLQ